MFSRISAISTRLFSTSDEQIEFRTHKWLFLLQQFAAGTDEGKRAFAEVVGWKEGTPKDFGGEGIPWQKCILEQFHVELQLFPKRLEKAKKQKISVEGQYLEALLLFMEQNLFLHDSNAGSKELSLRYLQSILNYFTVLVRKYFSFQSETHHIFDKVIGTTAFLLLKYDTLDRSEFLQSMFYLIACDAEQCIQCVQDQCAVLVSAKYALIELCPEYYPQVPVFPYETHLVLLIDHLRKNSQFPVDRVESEVFDLIQSPHAISQPNILLSALIHLSYFHDDMILLQDFVSQYLKFLHTSTYPRHSQTLLLFYKSIDSHHPIHDMIDDWTPFPCPSTPSPLVYAQVYHMLRRNPNKSLDILQRLERDLVLVESDLHIKLLQPLFEILWKDENAHRRNILAAISLAMSKSIKALGTVCEYFDNGSDVSHLVDEIPLHKEQRLEDPILYCRLLSMGSDALWDGVIECLEMDEFCSSGDWDSGMRIIEMCVRGICKSGLSLFSSIKERVERILHLVILRFEHFDIIQQSKLLLGILNQVNAKEAKSILMNEIAEDLLLDPEHDDIFDKDVLVEDLESILILKRNDCSYPIRLSLSSTITIPFTIQLKNDSTISVSEIYAISIEFEGFPEIQPIHISNLGNNAPSVLVSLEIPTSLRESLHEPLVAHAKFTDSRGILYRGYSSTLLLSLIDFAIPVFEPLKSHQLMTQSFAFREIDEKETWKRIESFLGPFKSSDSSFSMQFSSSSHLVLNLQYSLNGLFVYIACDDIHLLRHCDAMIDTILGQPIPHEA